MDLVGRDSEIAWIAEAIATIRAGSHGIVIEGEAGVGKTIVWSRTLEEAKRAGLRVLETRPTEADSRLSFLGLHDLLDPVANELIGVLPEPQARALGVALRRFEPGEPLDQAIVAIAVLGGLRYLAAQQPVLLAIDDAHWLDTSTIAVLGSAIRRLRDEPVLVLTAKRIQQPPVGLDVLRLMGDRAQRATLQGLPVGALHHLIRMRLGITLPRPRLLRLHDATRGNPYFALELAAALAARPAAHLDDVLAGDLRALLADRVSALPSTVGRVLLVTALASRPTSDLIARALATDRDAVERELEQAQAAHVLVRDRGFVQFAHPLLAAVVRNEASQADRRTLHDALAGVSADAEERVRHLALAKEGVDERVAAALEAAAAGAMARGATIAGLEMLERAVELTPPDHGEELGRRTVRQAEALFLVGETTRAHRILADVAPALPTGEDRHAAILLLATITWYDADSRDAACLAESELATIDDPVWRGRYHTRLSWIYEHDLRKALDHDLRALEVLSPEMNPALYAFALLGRAADELHLGIRADHESIARGHELQERTQVWEFSTIPANWAMWMGQLDRAREITEAYLERARATGDESSIAQFHAYLSELALWTGDTTQAATLADQALEHAEQTEQPGFVGAALARRAMVRAHRGDLEGAEADAEATLAIGKQMNSAPLIAFANQAIAFVGLTRADLETVDASLSRAEAVLREAGDLVQPAFRFEADHVEALILLGHLDGAEALLAERERYARLGPRPWAEASLTRCRALLAAAKGNLMGALDAGHRAITLSEELGMPFELARAHLVVGQLERRAGRRRAARASLGRAAGLFREVGAELWAARAENDAARLGLSGRSAGLTPSEDRIARLAASGLPNREVARLLGISPKTVEANLARVYAKLGIRSRAELGAAVATGADRQLSKE